MSEVRPDLQPAASAAQDHGICDDDGTALITRKDDQDDVVKERIRTYDAVSRPVIAHYQDSNYHQIRGDRSPGYIFEEITGILEPLVSKNGASGKSASEKALVDERANSGVHFVALFVNHPVGAVRDALYGESGTN